MWPNPNRSWDDDDTFWTVVWGVVLIVVIAVV